MRVQWDVSTGVLDLALEDVVIHVLDHAKTLVRVVAMNVLEHARTLVQVVAMNVLEHAKTLAQVHADIRVGRL